MNKEIRFVDTHYKTLFNVPDGGSVAITDCTGKETTYKCKYLDDYHLEISGNCWHIMQLAEFLERNGATCRAIDDVTKGKKLTHDR